MTEETDKRTSFEEESGSDSRSESGSDPYSGSDFWSESSSELDIPLPSLRKMTCLRVQRIVAPKMTYLNKADSHLPMKQK